MAELVDAYLLVLRLKHDLQTWGSSTHRGLVHMSPSAIKKNTHHAGSSPALTTKKCYCGSDLLQPSDSRERPAFYCLI